MNTGGVSAAVSTIELHADLIEEILFKLPSETLIRFRCVSKEWNTTISSNKFIHQHWCNNPHSDGSGSIGNPDSFIVTHRSYRPVDKYITRLSLSHWSDGRLVSNIDESFRLPFITSSPDPFIFHAGFGVYALFCLRFGEVALWNPTIKQITNIPPSPFRPKKENHEYQNGLANVSYEDGIFSYKVALLRHRYYSGFILVTMELYSSTNVSWKLFKDYHSTEITGIGSVDLLYPGTNLNNRFHWFSNLCAEDLHIVTFDLKTEEFGRIEVPSFLQGNLEYDMSRSHFTNFDGKYLCLLLTREKGDNVYLEVWIMVEYGIQKSWTLKSTGPISTIHTPWLAKSVGATSDGVFFYGADDGEGLFFCPYGSTKDEIFLPVERDQFEVYRFVEYRDSLVSFKGKYDKRTRRIP